MPVVTSTHLGFQKKERRENKRTMRYLAYGKEEAIVVSSFQCTFSSRRMTLCTRDLFAPSDCERRKFNSMESIRKTSLQSKKACHCNRDTLILRVSRKKLNYNNSAEHRILPTMPTLPHRPNSKLGMMTGPYLTGAAYAPSFCTMKSAARLRRLEPLLPGTMEPWDPRTVSGS